MFSHLIHSSNYKIQISFNSLTSHFNSLTSHLAVRLLEATQDPLWRMQPDTPDTVLTLPHIPSTGDICIHICHCSSHLGAGKAGEGSACTCEQWDSAIGCKVGGWTSVKLVVYHTLNLHASNHSNLPYMHITTRKTHLLDTHHKSFYTQPSNDAHENDSKGSA